MTKTTTAITDFDFDLDDRFDDDLAHEGMWVEYYSDVQGKSFGKFKLRLIDSQTKHTQKYFAALARKNATTTAKPLDTEERKRANVEYLVDLGVVDWEIKDRKGNAIPFSKDAAMAYFMSPRASDVADFCSVFCQNLANFQPGRTKEDIVGN